MRSFAKRFVGFVVLATLGISLISCKGDTAPNKGTSSRPSEPTTDPGKPRESVEDPKKTIVAKVNGVPISVDELVREMNTIAPQYVKPGQKTDPPTDEKIRKEALDRLIYRELAVQEAKRQGMKAPKGAVAEELKKIKAEMKTEDAFRQNLAKSGITEEELKRQIERNILVEMIAEKEIFGKVKLKPDAARNTFAMTLAVQNREDEWVEGLKKAARIEISPGPPAKGIRRTD